MHSHIVTTELAVRSDSNAFLQFSIAVSSGLLPDETHRTLELATFETSVALCCFPEVSEYEFPTSVNGIGYFLEGITNTFLPVGRSNS